MKMTLGYIFIFAVIAQWASVLCLPKDCQDIYELGFNTTAKYVIYPEKTNGFAVRYDMDTGTGGWTVIQRRVSDSDFYKKWSEYQYGFGEFSNNFWLGLLQIHAITAQSTYELRIDMTHSTGTQAYVAYKRFAVGDIESKYRLVVNGYYGNAGDSLIGHGSWNGFKFSTHDQDNDLDTSNCAKSFVGAWWYGACHTSNLNGDYGNTAYAKGLAWHTLTGFYTSLTSVEMKVRHSAPYYTNVGVSF